MKVDFAACLAAPCSGGQIAQNQAAARARGLPDIATLPQPDRPRLAIVGGGPSIRRHVNALRTWKGDVWALNNAAAWCGRNRIRCSLFTIESDPRAPFDPALAAMVRHAILSTRCGPGLFDLLGGARIVTYDLAERDIGPGSAANAFTIGCRVGYREFGLFGCEANFAAADHHGYAQNDGDSEGRNIVVACGGRRFLTRPDLLSTTLALALLCRGFPDQVKDRSGGLLAALIRDIDYDLVGVAPALATAATIPALIEGYRAFIA